MNIIKKGIGALLIAGLMVSSCSEDDTVKAPTEGINPAGLSKIVMNGFSVAASGDGTIVTVTPSSVGASSFSVDFGDSNVLTITDGNGSVSHDYSNVVEVVDYTITVTALSDAGRASVTQSTGITVVHTPEFSGSDASTPSGKKYNLFNVFADEVYSNGTSTSGGTVIATDSGNSVLEFSRLHSSSGDLSLGDEVVVADAFVSGVGSASIHFDVHSNFASGIDVLKITLVDNTNSTNHVVDGLALTDGDWTSFDFDFATDFSNGAVVQFDEIIFEVGAGGSAMDHATIHIDNIYMPRATGSSIINGDFENSTNFWKWTTFTDGTTNPYGSSSDGSDFDINGVDQGGKTRGAKWSGSQAGGEFRSSGSRYAYQELLLTPDADYIMTYQYAMKTDSATDPVGGRHVVGLILDSYYDDGADAADNLGNNLGFHQGYIAGGKFSSTPNDEGTRVSIPFTAPSSGECAVMFYSVSPKDAWIDNVVVELATP